MFQAIAADINCTKLPCFLVCTSTSNGFPELALFHIQILVLLRKENGRVSLFNCTKTLGVGEVGNMTPMNLARKVFSYWFNLLVIQKVTGTII